MKSNHLRRYGESPYGVAVVHGGPGAAGEMAPVAKAIAARYGVLEPLQTADSLAGQIDELKTVLINHGDIPVILIGYSWGAWLSWLLTARFPGLVKKLILIGTPPFTEPFARQIEINRINRLNEAEKSEFTAIVTALTNNDNTDPASLLLRLGELTGKTDSYDLLPAEGNLADEVEVNGDIFRKVWPEAAAMRGNGTLMDLGKRIGCPVIAIHGDYDPHPAQGVEDPLRKILRKFRLTVLPKCGHTPWRERQARDPFFQLLEKEITDDHK